MNAGRCICGWWAIILLVCELLSSMQRSRPSSCYYSEREDSDALGMTNITIYDWQLRHD